MEGRPALSDTQNFTTIFIENIGVSLKTGSAVIVKLPRTPLGKTFVYAPETMYVLSY